MTTSFGPDRPPAPERPLDEAPAPKDSVRRLPLRLRLSSDFGHGRLHGAWWPQSRDLETELTDLVGHFPRRLGRVVGALYSRPDWLGPPRNLEVGGSVVKVARLQQDDGHLLILTLSTRNLSLLVVPPGTPEREAARIMSLAASSSNQASARDILVTTPVRAPSTDSDQWDDHGPAWWAPNPVPPSYRVREGRARGPRSSPPRAPAQLAPRRGIEFHEEHGVYSGCSEAGRRWRISPELSGWWRLEFRDAGDDVATNAGLHPNVEAAIAEANR